MSTMQPFLLILSLHRLLDCYTQISKNYFPVLLVISPSLLYTVVMLIIIYNLLCRVVSLCMSPINDSFMSGSLDHSVRIWDLRVNACQVGNFLLVWLIINIQGVIKRGKEEKSTTL